MPLRGATWDENVGAGLRTATELDPGESPLRDRLPHSTPFSREFFMPGCGAEWDEDVADYGVGVRSVRRFWVSMPPRAAPQCMKIFPPGKGGQRFRKGTRGGCLTGMNRDIPGGFAATPL